MPPIRYEPKMKKREPKAESKKDTGKETAMEDRMDMMKHPNKFHKKGSK